MTVAASVRQDDWAWVPLDFPAERWTSEQQWAHDVGDALAGDVVDDRERWRAMAATVAALPVPSADVVARVWHTAPGTGTLVVGHVRAADDEGEDPGDLALVGLRTGVVQRMLGVEHPRLAAAFHSVGVGETQDGVALGVLRWSGVASGTRVTLEAMHPEPPRLARASAAFAALFLALGVDA
ncbi:hypothetical protein C1N71_12230 [Agrococcus sp. SGAir0287]|nr:hypothetical protein C1N71_12230 [Agrococcus sp. SGAir0287]